MFTSKNCYRLIWGVLDALEGKCDMDEDSMVQSITSARKKQIGDTLVSIIKITYLSGRIEYETYCPVTMLEPERFDDYSKANKCFEEQTTKLYRMIGQEVARLKHIIWR